jgi:hypothetical protein
LHTRALDHGHAAASQRFAIECWIWLVGVRIATTVNALRLRRRLGWPRNQADAEQSKITNEERQKWAHEKVLVETKKDGLRRPLIALAVATNYSE